MKPNILLFMSDQHTPYYSGFYGDKLVHTPNLNKIVEHGTIFDEAYTVCPICVPARMAMLSGCRPSRTGILRNDYSLSDLTPTFLHHLVAQGYETVLVGRMHFIGNDQRHGFTKRIAPDCTTISWSRTNHSQTRGVYEKAYGGYYNTNLVGGGTSSSSYYDQHIIDKAIEYLNEPHDKPQFIVVSIYSPHHPYVGPKDLYEKYRGTVQLSASFHDKSEADIWKSLSRDYVNEQLSLDIKAAYCAMIEELDQRLGLVKDAFDLYCKKQNSKRLFIYVSDHGDTVGDRNAYGKVSFYEKSVKIPLLFEGDNVIKKREQNPVSILDIAPTILEYAGCESMEDIDGISLFSDLTMGIVPSHDVYSEVLSVQEETYAYSFMIKYLQYKYICFSNEKTELLYDTVQDPEELHNMIHELPNIAVMLRKKAENLRMDTAAIENYQRNKKNVRLWAAFERAIENRYENDLFQETPPQEYLDYPEILSLNVTKL